MIYQVPHKNTFGKDQYAYWENFLTDEEINQILALPQWHQMTEGRIGGASEVNDLNKEVRSSSISWFLPTAETNHIWKKMTETISEVNSRFFQFEITGCYEPAQLGLYKAESEDKYEWHTDAIPQDRAVPRKLSMALMLSDPSEFEGGDLQIKTNSDQPITLEQKRGRAWFFPSYTLHRVTPVTKGVRRSLVLWVGGPQFR